MTVAEEILNKWQSEEQLQTKCAEQRQRATEREKGESVIQLWKVFLKRKVSLYFPLLIIFYSKHTHTDQNKGLCSWPDHCKTIETSPNKKKGVSHPKFSIRYDPRLPLSNVLED